MTEPVDLRPDHANIVHEILSSHLPAGAWARVFGSRAKWTAKPHSDLDLALKAKQVLPSSLMSELAEAFSESDLPFKVDVVDWHAVEPDFQAVIDRDAVILPWPTFPLKRFIDPERAICYGIVQPGKPVIDGVPIVRVNNFEAGSLDTSHILRVDKDIEAQYDRSRLRGGEILVTLVGSVGQCVIAPSELRGWNVARAVGVVPVKDRVLTRWVKSVIASKPAQNFLAQRANTTVQTTVNLRDLADLPIPSPPPLVMEQIVALVAAFDDKIELNRRMNQTLEAQARAMFRDWFVDFAPVKAKMAGATPYLAPDFWSLFPDRLGDDGVPEGWRTFRVDEVARHHTRTLTPMNAPSELFEHFSLPAFDSGQQPVLEPGAGIRSNKTIVPEGAILLSKLNPEIPRVWWPNARGEHRQIASTEFLTFTPIGGFTQSLLYSLFSGYAFRQRLEGMVTGTSKSHQRVNPKALSALDALVGEEQIISAFGQLCSPVMAKVLANRAEVVTLSHTRDLLLSKLMSGEIRVGGGAW